MSCPGDALVILLGNDDMLAALPPYTSSAIAAVQACLESGPAVIATLATAALRHAALGAAQRRHAVQLRRRQLRQSNHFHRPPSRGASRRIIFTRMSVVRTRRRGVGSSHVRVVGAVLRLADEALTVGTQVPSTEHQRRRRTLGVVVSGSLRPAPCQTQFVCCAITVVGYWQVLLLMQVQ